MPPLPPIIPLPERFRLGERIASGGMGGVWAAEDATLGRRVAIKVLADHLAADPTYRARFAREARAAARVSSHPNIVTIYDVGEAGERPYLVMELMEGGDLGARLRAGRTEPADAVEWLAGAAAGLDHGHAQGVIHRDVKPGNLLLDRTGRRVAVADFGIARLDSEHTLTGSGELLGTAAYLAPEQVQGERATARSDVYALSVVAFELLTGGRPFRSPHLAGGSEDDTAPRASERAPELPPAVDSVLARGLAADPADRPATCSALVGELRAALADRPAGTAPVLVHRSRRRGRPLLAALGVLLALGVALAALLGSSGDGSGPARTTVAHKRTRTRPARRPAPTQTAAAAAPTPAATRPAATTSTTTTTPVTGSATALEASGHALLAAGHASEAVPVLQRAVQATGESTDRCIEPTGACLTYAYALYDLGHALRLAGRSQDAIPILRDRLRIDNARSVVLAELRAAGGAGAATGSAPARPEKKAKPGHGPKSD